MLSDAAWPLFNNLGPTGGHIHEKRYSMGIGYLYHAGTALAVSAHCSASYRSFDHVIPD
jgi:hypothetical protein